MKLEVGEYYLSAGGNKKKGNRKKRRLKSVTYKFFKGEKRTLEL